jgi:DNA-binding transcriptional LysR family regulator
MFRLEDLTLFVRAAALGSFSDAAREVGQQPAQVSAAIKRLETTLNIRLFARSTRSLRLTPEGKPGCPMPPRCWIRCMPGCKNSGAG